MRGRGAARVVAVRQGGRLGVGGGWIEERVQEAAHVLSYKQVAALFAI